MEKKLAELEVLLFVQGEPLSKKKAQKLLDLKGDEFESLLDEFGKHLSDANRGLSLLRDDDKIQLATKPELKTLVENFVKSELSEDLTPASLEVLSLITYLGPVSKSQIEYRRGVNSSFTLRNLLIRGLIERLPSPSQLSPGESWEGRSGRAGANLYRPSFEFLRHLGVAKKEELPEYEKFSSVLAGTEQSAVSSEGPQE